VNTLVKTAEQIEFAAIFARLEKALDISRAEVARALRVERSYISMLINGQRTPRGRLLEDMRELEKEMLAGRSTKPATEGESELNRVFNQLRTLERTEPAKFEAARLMIQSLVPVNSKPASAASKLLKKASASVRKPGPK
jgi:transcriptional regulator with XRE-family HTH domain